MSYPDSDAVTVKITIRKADQQKFEEICLDFTACAPLPPVEGVELIQYQFDNCHYASIGTENEEIYLEQDKIPYDKEWPDGHEYRAGKRHLRVTQDGEINKKEYREFKVMVDVKDVEKALKQGTLTDFLAEQKSLNAIMTWPEQEAILRKRAAAAHKLPKL